MPQLAMHSIREMCAVADVGACHRAFLSFFRNIGEIDANVDPDTLPQVGSCACCTALPTANGCPHVVLHLPQLVNDAC